MKMMVVALSMTLCGCGQGPNNIDPALQPIYDQFIKDSGTYGHQLQSNQGLTVQFSKLEEQTTLGEVIGECSSVGYGGGTVTIDPGFWNQAGPDLQLILAYHEFGHCVLNLYHTTDAENIMNPLINNPFYYYSTGLDVMLRKLFE